MDAVLAFVDAMHASGMHPAEPVALMLQSGQRIRFECEGDRKGRKNGWAILHLDGQPAGAFGHYRLGICQRWRSGQTVGLTLAERKALAAEIEANRQQREREREAGWRAVAGRAVALWEGSGPADAAHPYLCRKNATPEGLRQSGRALILPMRDAQGAIWNVQKIFPDGAKRFLSGGRMQGLMWQTGSDEGSLCMGEGFATMAAVRAATGMAVCAALSADNPMAFDRYMKVALKAQAQCRTTVEALAAIKNPPVVYARQANIAAGPQQVNNGLANDAPAPAREQKKRKAPNELLEGPDGEA